MGHTDLSLSGQLHESFRSRRRSGGRAGGGDPAHAVILRPANVLLTDAALQHRIFDQAPNWMVRQCGYDRGFHSKTAPEASGDVVFTAAFPHAKMTRGRDAFIPRVEAKDHFSQTDCVPYTTTLGCSALP